MKILQVLSSLDPKGGGPVESVRQASHELQKSHHRVEVVTLDDPKEAFIGSFPMTVHAVGPSSTGYGYNANLVPWLRNHASEYDAVIVHGLWQYHGFGTWRALHKSKVSYYVFSHGMLDPWFKREYPLKHLKKWLYWPWAEYRVLRDARAVLFTCEEERLLARQSFALYRARERVVAYGTADPPVDLQHCRQEFLAANPSLHDKRLLLFLGRVHEKKGCDLLIRAFAKVAALDAQLHLVVAGPDQTGWQSHLTDLAATLGVAGRITWPGMLHDEMKWGAFASAEAFVLPSHQENFGIAVAEALGCGLPVLISDKVNIWREIETAGAGIVDGDTEEGATRMLQRWLALNSQQREAMKLAAFDLFKSQFTARAMARSLIDVIGDDHSGSMQGRSRGRETPMRVCNPHPEHST